MRILYLSRWFPYPPTNGSKLRIYNLLRGLVAHHKVSLISFIDEPGIEPNITHMQSICEKIVLVPIRFYNPGGMQSKLSFFSPVPRYYRETYSPEMARFIDDTLNSDSYDLVIASQIDTAAYVKHFHSRRAIFDEVEIGVSYENYSKSDSLMQRIRNGLTWEKHRWYLSRLLKDYQACTVVSSDEKKLLAETIPNYDRIFIIPNCVEYDEYHKFEKDPQPNTLIFTGSFRYTPNYEAMKWFIHFIFPVLRNKIPDIKLIITGDPAGKDFSHEANVVQSGLVDDIRSLIAGSWV